MKMRSSWVQPLHSTMASSESRDILEAIEKTWESWVADPRCSASSVTKREARLM